ncbi:hypothetical protein BT67DRAFT_131098 [Trichocladium antarcticum]|uniref:Uncharacterized protein n=1 Tax=Trichocladium antarcticum TaxID=1450529 RepID=A0AAN6ZHV9_9PEZI|nr:hypothetical protein BT67DRAFT_131098 [Trichocladium antarcticum]
MYISPQLAPSHRTPSACSLCLSRCWPCPPAHGISTANGPRMQDIHSCGLVVSPWQQANNASRQSGMRAEWWVVRDSRAVVAQGQGAMYWMYVCRYVIVCIHVSGGGGVAAGADSRKRPYRICFDETRGEYAVPGPVHAMGPPLTVSSARAPGDANFYWVNWCRGVAARGSPRPPEAPSLRFSLCSYRLGP